eukprot:362741-Chlamydomonas_euryale.AAC.4
MPISRSPSSLRKAQHETGEPMNIMRRSVLSRSNTWREGVGACDGVGVCAVRVRGWHVRSAREGLACAQCT